MACGEQKDGLKEEVSCSICWDIFTEPVALDCMHTFCKHCIIRFWGQGCGRAAPSCPQCRQEFRKKSFRPNYVVRGVAEKVKRSSTEDYKRKAQNQLEDELRHHRRQIEELFNSLVHNELKINTIKKTAEKLNKNIQDDFGQLHQILFDQEQALLDQLKQEEEEAVIKLQRHANQVKDGIAELERTIEWIYRSMEGLNSIAVLAEIQSWDIRPSVEVEKEPDMGAVFTVEARSGLLQYITWRKMFKFIQPAPAPLTFDQSTAHPSLLLSDGLTVVSDGDCRKQLLPVFNSPKCFQKCLNVLASEGYSGGRHYWEVLVGKKAKWDLGVAAESVDRKARVKLCPENGYWTLRLQNPGEYWAATVPWTSLHLKRNPEGIGVLLDFEEGKVSFFDTSDMACLFTFQQAFSDKIYPFFSPCLSHGDRNTEPLQICHVPVIH
ncbi:tripartite motif containing 105 [Latimeria chalumnae]|uniref:tripartite motif containing 105 n=1 Tax=Latimeria chalumnae TaxID=7897 RepID=UPI0006D8E081|nr:PREDICTED: zinc-binding protein A33-like [Latimeria chalumnae]|eukprot:XP_014351456.1 PREDICTED: zinc-binding protein A33-like [Latimeria chalumnae]